MRMTLPLALLVCGSLSIGHRAEAQGEYPITAALDGVYVSTDPHAAIYRLALDRQNGTFAMALHAFGGQPVAYEGSYTVEVVGGVAQYSFAWADAFHEDWSEWKVNVTGNDGAIHLEGATSGASGDLVKGYQSDWGSYQGTGDQAGELTWLEVWGETEPGIEEPWNTGVLFYQAVILSPERNPMSIAGELLWNEHQIVLKSIDGLRILATFVVDGYDDTAIYYYPEGAPEHRFGLSTVTGQ